MGDPTADLFDRLGRRGHEALLEPIKGTIRFDLASDTKSEHWFVAVDRGDVRVSREERDADCVVHTTKARFDRLVTGEANALAMLLRADIVVQGDIQLLVVLERLLPGPPGARSPQEWTGDRGRDDE